MRISATGLHAAQTLLDVHAHNIANASTAGFRPSRVELRSVEPRGGVAVGGIGPDAAAPAPPDGLSATDLAAEVVGVVMSRTLYAANARAFGVMADTERALLDVLA